MYTHIGNNVILKNEEIIAILNLEKMEGNKVFQKFYESLKQENRIFVTSKQKEKTFIITKEKGEIKGYLTNISSTTIGKRGL